MRWFTGDFLREEFIGHQDEREKEDNKMSMEIPSHTSTEILDGREIIGHL
jgi:hypothetical protein